ncbi:MAG: Na+/H+ antiporter NhaC family protein [Anaerococcus sp.]|uniref:Na+/H+ antiporter NhaC family protein n=1 Tax=Anaerococcus sp. TaxID=1872515 RepID=UPI00290820A4|nr:Na+/H+ antiporter NhaC family protein [Anaerococcus sp.]MDU4025298.1 Na+/H+ antiporter NhaC family protein [Anaerococcus sp.]
MDTKKLKPALAIALLSVGLAIYIAITGKTTEASIWSLFPPLVAIFVALFTKEVFSSLFLGIVTGAILSSSGSFGVFLNNLVQEGFITSISGSSGIFIFLVVLGIMVVLINYSGGSKAFGDWANSKIKTRKGSQLATFCLCIMLFIDDYFNCLTSGSVMKSITDSHKVSRAKLAYIIDATAAPVCMIAPISSWAAAVSGYAENSHMSGIELFVRSIPFNFYSLLTLVFVINIIAFDNDFGPMKKYEKRAMEEGYLGISKDNNVSDLDQNLNGSVIDLVFPVLVLIISCVISLINVGGFFDLNSPFYHDFVNAFANTDSSIALAMGSIIALIITIIFFVVKKSITFEKSMDAISEGFSSMVAAILILTMATSLKNISNDLLGSTQYVGGLMENVAGSLNSFLPVVIFIVAIFLAFATGTSWGTFGILIPIVVSMFEPTDPIFFIGISATLSGAVCGDHLSPISDTTIMSSTGAGCIHIDHVKTQLPYGMSVAAISAVAYIIAGFTHSALISLSFGLIVIFALMYILKLKNKKELSL